MDDRIHQNALESKPIEILKVPSPYVWYLYFLFVIVVHYICEPLTEQLVTYSVGKRRTRRLPQLLSIATSLYWMAMFVAQLNTDSRRVVPSLTACLSIHDQQDSTLLL